MKEYNILIKDVYTNEKRSETIVCEENVDIRVVHKQALKKVKRHEDIECVSHNRKLLYTIDKGFLI